MAAIHRRVPALRLDVHVVSLHTRRLVDALAQAGAARLTFQYELLLGHDTDTDNSPDIDPNKDGNNAENQDGTSNTRDDDRDHGNGNSVSVNRVLAFARTVRAAGMLCGVCLAPGTSDAVLAPLLREWYAPGDALVDYVDVLAVHPGIGGQALDPAVLGKVARIYEAYQRPSVGGESCKGGEGGENGEDGVVSRPVLRYLAVDGGVDRHTAQAAAAAGANVLIAGEGVGDGEDRTTQGRERGKVV